MVWYSSVTDKGRARKNMIHRMEPATLDQTVASMPFGTQEIHYEPGPSSLKNELLKMFSDIWVFAYYVNLSRELGGHIFLNREDKFGFIITELSDVEFRFEKMNLQYIERVIEIG